MARERFACLSFMRRWGKMHPHPRNVMLLVAFILTPLAYALDFDTDGYQAPPAVGHPDCDDSNRFISPKAQEIVGDLVDQDCDGSDALRRWLLIDSFHHLDWTTTLPSVSYTGDTIDFEWGSAGYRSLSIAGSTGIVHVALGVVASTGSCGVVLTGSPSFPALGPPVSQIQFLVGTGIQVLSFPSMPNPPRILTNLEIRCDLTGDAVEIDWISIQNTADIAFPPSADISVQWQDVEAPGGGLHTGVVRAASNGILIGGSDVGGVGIKDPLNSANPTWRTINGFGFDGLAAAQDLSVWDVAGVDWDSDSAGHNEIYALTGASYAGSVFGGLWRSDDEGEHWVQVADSLVDGVGYDGRADECNDKYYGGGQLLVPDESRQVLYVASNHEHTYYDLDSSSTYERATGVYLWDDDSTTPLCELPSTDLPSDQYISSMALAQTYAAPGQSNPVLMVGYKGSGSTKDSLYLCRLPFDSGSPTDSTLDCDSPATVTCTAVSDAEGIDVRDLEVDVFEPSIVYIADGGDDPDTGTCNENPGNLFSMQVTSAGWIWDGDFADPTWLTSAFGLTGLSMDPDGEFLFAFIPLENGNLYGSGGMYRIPYVDIGDPYAWQQIDELGDEADRRTLTDYSGGWLEASIVARPVPEPELWSPGLAVDAIWYEALDSSAHAVISTANNMWDVAGLSDSFAGWDAEDDTVWTFWPEPDLSEPFTFQTMSMPDAAVDSEQNLWMATGDHALFMLPDGAPAAERDCLFEMFSAGSQDIAIGTDDSIWLSLGEQGNYGIPHRSGVFRTIDYGATWGYQGAGVEAVPSRDSRNRVQCRDEYVGHLAAPLDGLDGGTKFSFDPLGIYGSELPTSTLLAAFGNPGSIDALNEKIAVLVFSSYSALNSLGASYVIPGRVAYTLDGGASWAQVAYDGDADPAITGVECDEYRFFEALPDISLVKPRVNTRWWDSNQNNVVDGGEWNIDFVIGARDKPGGVVVPDSCSLAHVQLDSSSTSWDWIKLDKESSTSYGGCRVDVGNLAGVGVSPWSPHAIVWGYYSLVRAAPPNEYGGACLVNLNNHSVQTLISPMNSDNQFELDIGKIIPHPQVSNLFMAVTRITAASTGECAKPFIDGDPDICPPVAWPYLVTGGGSTWSAVPLTDVPPSLVGKGGAWGNIEDNTFYYVGGGGAWRGTLSW